MFPSVPKTELCAEEMLGKYLFMNEITVPPPFAYVFFKFLKL